MEDRDWNGLLGSVGELQEWFPEGLVFIGGIAVFAHMSADPETAAYGARSHDADFMIALPEYIDLKDIEAVTPNRRLRKHQFVKAGFEFDVYVEGQNDLAVPVDEAIAASRIRSGVRVACPEHLLVLKAVALADRRGSQKGDKDEDDIFRILLASRDIDPALLVRMTDVMLDDVLSAASGGASMRLAGGNAHLAKSLRVRIEPALDALRSAFSANYGR